MSNKLQIQNTQIVVSFNRNPFVRKRIFDFEDLLKSDFVIPLRAFPIADDFEPDLPRFEGYSTHGHSRIQISQNRITVATKYDIQYANSPIEASNYVKHKFKTLQRLAEQEKINFIACLVELVVYFPDGLINPFLKENTGFFALNADCKSFELGYSKRYQKDFYLNVKCAKFEEQEVLIHENHPTVHTKQGLSILLDLNTKPLFESEQQFEPSLFEKLHKTIFDIIDSNEIENYLKGEVQ